MATTASRKVCRKCRILVKGKECPLCGGSDLTATWSGRVDVFDPALSQIAQSMNVTVKGKYALRVR